MELKDFIDLVGESFQVISIYERKPSIEFGNSSPGCGMEACWRGIQSGYRRLCTTESSSTPRNTNS